MASLSAFLWRTAKTVLCGACFVASNGCAKEAVKPPDPRTAPALPTFIRGLATHILFQHVNTDTAQIYIYNGSDVVEHLRHDGDGRLQAVMVTPYVTSWPSSGQSLDCSLASGSFLSVYTGVTAADTAWQYATEKAVITLSEENDVQLEMMKKWYFESILKRQVFRRVGAP